MNIQTLKKHELMSLANKRCSHHHSYLQHPACFAIDKKAKERIGFLDIEASNLDADFGMMLSYCIKDSLSNKIYESVLTTKDIHGEAGREDKRIVKNCVRDMMQFDRIVTFYGKGFDMPFIRTRALICGVDFPEYGAIIHDDVYFMAKFKLKLTSNRQENVCRNIIGKTEKNHIEAKYWRGGVRGDKKSLAYILDHNRRDVRDLEKIYTVLRKYVRRQNASA